MVLSAKAAATICIASIAGASWVLQETTIREVNLPSPLVASQEPIEVTLKGGAADEWTAPVEPIGWRVERAQRFASPNAFERQAEVNRAANAVVAVALVEPVDETPVDAAVERLPTLPRAWAAEAIAADAVEVAAADADEIEARDDVAVAAADVAPAEVAEPEVFQPVLRPHRVARGETLTGIARRQCGDDDTQLVKLLMALNPRVAKRRGHVQAGEIVLVPDKVTAARMLAVAGEGDVDTTRVVALACAGGGSASATNDARWYTIQRNDSLTRIAERFLHDGDRWPEILKLNRSLKANKIYPGTRIKLPPLIPVARG